MLQAELIPALQRQSPPPHLSYMRPGAAPLQSLALALTSGAEFEFRDAASLQRQWELSPPDVLIVNQFEELYALSEPSQVETFIDLLVSSAEGTRTRSVISVRSDFVSQVIANPKLAQVLSTATLFLGGLTKEQLRQLIEEPARAAGLSLEPGFVERVVADLGSDPGNLPAMQLVLDSMYRATPDHTLSHQGYARTSGAPGVIARHCEDF